MPPWKKGNAKLCLCRRKEMNSNAYVKKKTKNYAHLEEKKNSYAHVEERKLNKAELSRVITGK